MTQAKCVSTLLYIEIVFELNPVKDARNLRDHGISFATAQEVFSDPNQVVSENYFVEGEQRYQIIGMTKSLALLLVVYADHSNPESGNHQNYFRQKGGSV